MDKYATLAPTGQHRGPAAGSQPPAPGSADTTEVRAPAAPDAMGQKASGIVRTGEGLAVPPHADGKSDEGAAEEQVGRSGSLADAPTKPAETRHVVFENTKTGEVYLDSGGNVADNVSDGGRFDKVTAFDDEAEAAAYASRVQRPDRPAEP